MQKKWVRKYLQSYADFFCLSTPVKVPEYIRNRNEPRHESSNNVVCATSKASDQPAHTRSLIRTIACRLIIL